MIAPMSHRMRTFGTALLAILWSAAAVPVLAGSDDPAIFVKSLGDRAIMVLSDENSTRESRKSEYRKLLDEGFAVNTIGRFALGRHWRAATEDERVEYLDLFRTFVLDIYAERLDGFTGETFVVIESHALDDKDTMVSTEIGGESGPAIRVDYRVRSHDGTHKIIDVMVEGISLIVTQRSEFASVINREGFEGLMARLRQYDSGGYLTN
jgi:phospholipid transport system substrate-binding protein